jgi:hypothetical protein
MLGLAVSRQGVAVAQVAGGRLLKWASIPAAAPPQDVAAAGASLRDLLRREGISGGRCAIGLEASFLAARSKQLPAAAAGSLADILRLAAEQDFASDGGDLAIDFAHAAGEGGVAVLLAAAPRAAVDYWMAVAQAAGLAPQVVTATAASLSQAAPAAAGGPDGWLLHLAAGGAELVYRRGPTPLMLRWLPAESDDGAAYLSQIEPQLRRAMASVPAACGDMAICNARGLDQMLLMDMMKSLGLQARSVAVGGAAAQQQPAAAVAMATGGDEAAALDFVHSRLTPPRPRRFGRAATWAAIAAGVLVVLGGLLAWDYYGSLSQSRQLQAKIAELEPSVVIARDTVARATFARDWYDRRPKIHAGLCELANAFPADSNRIWATSVVVKDDMRIVITGKCAGDEPALALAARLRANPRISDVQASQITQASASSREFAFLISFVYKPVE